MSGHASANSEDKDLPIQPKQSLVRRLLLYVLFIMLLTATFAGLIQSYVSLKLELQNRDSSIRYSIDTISPILENSLWTYELYEIDAIANALIRNPYISGVRITDDSGGEITTHGIISKSIDLPTIDGIQLKTMKDNVVFQNLLYQVRIYHHEPHQKTRVGHLFISAPGELVFNRISTVHKAIFMTLVIMLILLASFFYIIQQKIVARPLKALTSNIKSLNPSPSLSDSEVRLIDKEHLLNRHDEIGELFKTFFQMRDNIQARDQQLLEHQKDLEDKVEQRTLQLRKSNSELEQSLKQLHMAQDELIETEKMAALGGLVSGVAHEVNTPLGISITAISHLSKEIRELKNAFHDDKITVTQLQTFIDEGDDTAQIILNNLQRAASLIHSFKQVAVDQSSEEIRKVNLAEYIEEVLRSLYPKFKKTNINIETHLEDDISINLYPGALAQVLTNLLMNALIHGFEHGNNSGLIKIQLRKEYDYIKLTIDDNGKGMSQVTINRIFEPFFTTQRGHGGSGLGMNIVYNLITQKLMGKISCTSKENQGSQFVVLLPIDGIALEENTL